MSVTMGFNGICNDGRSHHASTLAHSLPKRLGAFKENPVDDIKNELPLAMVNS